MAILTLLSAMLVGILSAVNRQWSLAQAQIERCQDGRAILDKMGSELKSAALPANLSSTTGLQFIVNPPSAEGNSFGINSSYLNSSAIFWQAPIAHNTALGDIAEVGYFVKWGGTNSSNPQAELCRFFVDPAVVQNSASVSNTNFLIYSQPGSWLTPNLIDAVAPASSAGNYVGWMADNVVGLWVRCLDAYGQPIMKSAPGAIPTVNYAAYGFDSRMGYTDSRGNVKNGVSQLSSGPGFTQNLCALPASVDIAIVVLDSKSALRITTAITPGATSTVTLDSFWTDINTFMTALPADVKQGARLYSTRVNLLNAR